MLLANLIFTLGVIVAWTAHSVRVRKQQQRLGGDLLLQIPFKRARYWTLVIAAIPVVYSLCIAIAVDQPLYDGADELIADVGGVFTGLLFWVAVFVYVRAGGFRSRLEIREHGILTSLYWPWERIRSYRIVDGRILRLVVSGYGAIDIRIPEQEVVAIQAVLDSKVSQRETAVAHTIEKEVAAGVV